MNWKIKASIQAAIGILPEQISYKIYYILQRNFGALRVTNPMGDFEKSNKICSYILKNNLQINNKKFLEIGTGRNFNTAIGIWLCGAREIITVDLNPYIQEELIRESLDYILNNKNKVIEKLKPNADLNELIKRINILSQIETINDLLEKIPITYLAPADAMSLKVIDKNYIDYHFSVNTLEHIPKNNIIEIFNEANRVVSKNGHLIHLIDMTDHFSHDDSSITAINFLKYSDKLWALIAGNRFMYHNRIRIDEFLIMFKQIGIDMVYIENENIDKRSYELLCNGFSLSSKFRTVKNDRLAITRIDFIGKFNH